MHTIYLGLGSNLGDRGDNLRKAIGALAPEVQVRVESGVYETPPWGVTDQPGFLNMTLKAETDLSPEKLREHVKRVEREVGRKHTFRWGPRVIDIDILLYDELIVDTPELVIPHPQLHKRPFVLVPLASIAPEVKHPLLGYSMKQLLDHVDTSGITPVAS